MNEGRDLSQSLASLKGSHLRFLYVLLHDLNFWDLVSSKTKELITSEQSNNFYSVIQKEAAKLSDKKDEELQLDLLLQLSKTLKLSVRHFHRPYELEKQGKEVVEEVFRQLTKQYKSFQAAFDQSSEDNKLKFIIHWEMAAMYNHLHEQEKEGDSLWTTEMIRYIQDLPGYQQEQLMQAFDMAAMTSIEMKRAIEVHGTIFVFIKIVERTGFQFYKFLLQVYTRNTVLSEEELDELDELDYFAWMTNPNLLLSLIFKGGGVLYRYQNLLFNKGMLPVVLMQAVLPYLVDKKEEEQDLSAICLSWEARFEEYRNILRTINELVIEHNSHEKQLELLRSDLHNEEKLLEETAAYYKQMQQKLKHLLKHDPASPYFGEWSVKNNRLKEKLAIIEAKLDQSATEKKGIIKSVTGFLKSSYLQTEKSQIEKKVDKIYEQMAAIVLEKYPDYEPELTAEIQRSAVQLQEINANKVELEENISELEQVIKNTKNKEKEEREKAEAAEKRSYGLREIYGEEISKENSHAAK